MSLFSKASSLMPEPPGAAPEPRYAPLRPTPSSVAQRAGPDDVSLAGHDRAFDRQQLAADFGPCQPGDLSDLRFLLGYAERGSGARPGTCSGCRKHADLAAVFLDQRVFTTLRQIFEISRSSARTPASRE